MTVKRIQSCLGQIENASICVKRLLRSSESRVIIRVFGDFANIFDMSDLAFGIDNKDCTSEAAIERTALNQDAVVFAKVRGAMSAQCFDVFDAFGTAPPLDAKRKIHADDQDFHVVQ